MKQINFNRKAAQSTRQDVDLAPATGPAGISAAPPACGIEALDSGLPLQRKADSSGAGIAPEGRPSPNRTGLPDSLKSGVESLSGFSLDDVRVHYNSPRPAQLQALAYTQGTDIHVGPGQERHIPHEAWHVVQQKQGRVRPTLQMKGAPINADSALEEEADRMGANALRGQKKYTVGMSGRLAGRPENGVIQGKFGFEVELGLALGWSDTNDKAQDKSQYSAPDTHLTKEPVAAEGTGFEVHLDHRSDIKVVQGSSAIVELVTKPPIDESTDSEETVKRRIKQMTDFVASAKLKTNDLTEREKLDAITGVALPKQKEGYLFVGGSEKGEQQLETGYMQATYAIKIEKVPQLFAQVAKPENTFNSVVRAAAKIISDRFSDQKTFKHFIVTLCKKADLLTKAWTLKTAGETKEENVYESAWDENLTAKFKERIPKIRAELPPLMGYFSLIANYLLLGKYIKKHPENNLRKNHLGLLFYKSRLSTLRKSLPAFSKWLLSDDDLRFSASDWLLKMSGREEEDFDDVQQKAFPATNSLTDITVFEWLDGILTGTEDKLFDNSKNAYSDEIAPYNVGKTDEQTIGVVLESRKVAPKGGFKYKAAVDEKDKYKELAPDIDQNQRKVTEWADIAVDLWKYLKSINDVE